MGSRGLASLLAVPPALRTALLQAALAGPPVAGFPSSGNSTATTFLQSRSLSRAISRAAPKKSLKTSPRASKPKPKQSKVKSASKPTKPTLRTTIKPASNTPTTNPAQTKPPNALSFLPSPTSSDDGTDDRFATVSLVTNTTLEDLDKARVLVGGGRFFHTSPRFLNLYYNTYVPEVCLLGRSNVGKSTLVNALMGLGGKEAGTAHGPQARGAGFAVTSARAGCTRTMNAYAFGPPIKKRSKSQEQMPRRPKEGGLSRSDRRKKKSEIQGPPSEHSLVLMDVPGYGHNSQTLWGEEIMKYLEKREMLRGAVLLIDATTGVKTADRKLMRVLRDFGVATSVVLTKSDGLVRSPDHDAWTTSDRLKEASRHVVEEMRKIERRGDPETAWSEGIEWSPEVFATGAGDPRMGGMGVDGARLAIARMAGYIKQTKALVRAGQDEEDEPEIVPYDQLVFAPSTTVREAQAEVQSIEPELLPAEQRVFDPKRTQGRSRPGRRRRAVSTNSDDPMAALMGAGKEPRRKLEKASF